METTQTRRNFIKTLIGGSVALATGCSAAGKLAEITKAEAKPLTFEDLSTIRSGYMDATKGGEVSLKGLYTIVSNYERMTKNGIAKDAGEVVRTLYNTLKNEHELLVKDAYSNADLFLYIGEKTDMGSRGHNDVPVGKGASHTFSLDDKIALLRKSTEKAPKYTHDKDKVIPYQQVLGKGVRVDKEYVSGLVKDGKSYGDKDVPPSFLNGEVWTSLTDGKPENGEVRGTPAHLVVHAVYSGHKIK